VPRRRSQAAAHPVEHEMLYLRRILSVKGVDTYYGNIRAFLNFPHNIRMIFIKQNGVKTP